MILPNMFKVIKKMTVYKCRKDNKRLKQIINV